MNNFIDVWNKGLINKIALGGTALFLICCVGGLGIMLIPSVTPKLNSHPIDISTAIYETAHAISTKTQAASSPTSFSTQTLVPTTISKPSCTNLRFAEHLGPDSIDEMLNEGSPFSNVSEISVRFDCTQTLPDQIRWEWKFNNELHCTNTYQSNECDQSKLISWDSEPGKFFISLFSKDGYLGDLQSGVYELIIYVSGEEVLNGYIEISN